MPTGIIYALPNVPPPPPVPLMIQTLVTWTGWDGSKWELTNPATGVCLLRDGVEGLHHPAFTQWARKSPALPGQVFTGAIADPRKVVLPLLVFVGDADTTGQWVTRDRAFWKSVHPAREGTLTVEPAGAGSRRSIRLRYVPGTHVYPTDPAHDRWAAYVADFIADDPFWRGFTTVDQWSAAPETLTEFYEQTGPQLININSGHTVSNAHVTNDGDEPAWPVWTVIGPSTAAAVGVDTDLVEVPWTVADGKAVVIDTDPRVRTAIEYDYTASPETFTNPVDHTADLTGAVDFAAIPPGGTVNLNIALTGAGAVRVEFTPLYWRAW